MPFKSPLYHIPYEIDRFLLWDFPGSPQVQWSWKAASVECFVKSYLAIGGAENSRVRVEPAENRFLIIRVECVNQIGLCYHQHIGTLDLID